MQAVFFRACGLSSKGDAVPPGYVSGSGETGNDTPSRPHKVNCPERAREGALGYGGRGRAAAARTVE